MGFWQKLFGMQSPSNMSKAQGLRPDTAAEIGVAAMKMAEAGSLLINVRNAAEGREAMRKVAGLLSGIKGIGTDSRMGLLRDPSMLDDDQIMPLCRQMAANFAQQSAALAEVVNKHA